MCNRYGFDRELFEELEPVFPLPPNLDSREMYPKYRGPLAYLENGALVAAEAMWGFEPTWKPGLILNNTKIEGALESRYWKGYVERGRCLVPTTGFVEWTGEKGSKTAWRFAIEGHPAFVFAGICDRGEGPPEHYSIFTTEPTEWFSQYHDRMPVVMTVGEGLEWLRIAGAYDASAAVRSATDRALTVERTG